MSAANQTAAGVARRVEEELFAAERKAIDALARYKFIMFGYHAAWWVKLNRLSGLRRPNPFKGLVEHARSIDMGG